MATVLASPSEKPFCHLQSKYLKGGLRLPSLSWLMSPLQVHFTDEDTEVGSEGTQPGTQVVRGGASPSIQGPIVWGGSLKSGPGPWKGSLGTCVSSLCPCVWLVPLRDPQLSISGVRTGG